MSYPDSFQVAASRAYSAYGEDAWSRLNHRERSFAICEELRRLDAEQIASWLEPASGRRTSDAGKRPRDRKRESIDLPVPMTGKTKVYRVVVRAKQSGSKGYRWEIVSDDTEAIVRQSATWYNSMAQAYDCGITALAALSPSDAS
jgi:hypothetical protein